MVEARGIEPRSESPRSRGATCLVPTFRMTARLPGTKS